jgi:hypothetical protein
MLGRALRYELRFSVRVILAIVVMVTVLASVWPHTPDWIALLLGAAAGMAEDVWRKVAH